MRAIHAYRLVGTKVEQPERQKQTIFNMEHFERHKQAIKFQLYVGRLTVDRMVTGSISLKL